MKTMMTRKDSMVLGSVCLVAVAVLGVSTSASADSINIFGDAANSTEGLGDFSGMLSYDFIRGDMGVLTVDLTNLIDPDFGGFLTGFIFNIGSRDMDASVMLTSTDNPFFLDAPGQNGNPFGNPFVAGAALGGNWIDGGFPKDGIGPRDSGTFTFEFIATDAHSLSAVSFIQGPYEFNFIVRFRGIGPDGELQDKVPVDPGLSGDFQIFTDPNAFFQALEAKGKVSNGFWDFKPNNVGPGFIAGLSDPLNYLTAPGTGIWDNMPLDNIQFQSNLNPGGQGGPNPRGANGMNFGTAPFWNIKNNILVAGTFVDNFDILSGVPVDANHTAMALNVVNLAGRGDVHVTVWDKNEDHQTKLILPGPWQDIEKRFVGILATNDMTIGRVNIDDTWPGGGGIEGISAIEVFVSGDCPWDLDDNGTVGATDLLSLLVTWGVCAPCIDCPADFDHNCTVGATDLLALLANWGPCP